LRGYVRPEDGLGNGALTVRWAGKRAYVDEERTGWTLRAAGEGSGEAGSRTSLHQRGANRVADEVMHEAGLPEAHLCLSGMDVDINLLRGHLEEEQNNRIGGRWKDVAIGFVERVEDQFVADEALVDEDVDRVAVELLQLRLGDETGDAEVAGIGWSVVLFALPGWRLGQSGSGKIVGSM